MNGNNTSLQKLIIIEDDFVIKTLLCAALQNIILLLMLPENAMTRLSFMQQGEYTRYNHIRPEYS